WSLLGGDDFTTAQWILLQAAAAASICAALRMPWWWAVLNLAFAPALWIGLSASVSPAWSAAALFALLLVYGGTQRTRVPLYLSSAAAVRALRELLPADRPLAFLDIGAGTGTVVDAIANSHPQATVRGVERAPLPFLIAFVRALARARRYRVSWGNLWTTDLSGADVVYAYLSPAPMVALWEKARREMRPGTLLVSFRFTIPGVAPTRTVPVGNNFLYVWQLP
ncbi:MAG: hypothetical protein ABI624_20425, partial [Casimicrobiaceae bacterium]